METVLKIDNLTKLYKSNRGITDISLSIEKGEIMGLLGPNGSGKTTTMKIICGLCNADSGRVSVFGYNTAEEHEKALAEVGCLIEAPALYDYLSAYKNLKIVANLYENVTNDRIDEVLEIVKLTKYKNDKISIFSLGMKQRLGLALALLSHPRLIILDEPANGLDIEGMVFIRETIKELAQKEGITFLVSSHLSAEIEKMCDRVAVMYEGILLSVVTMEEALLFTPSLEDYYLEVVNKGGFRA